MLTVNFIHETFRVVASVYPLLRSAIDICTFVSIYLSHIVRKGLGFHIVNSSTEHIAIGRSSSFFVCWALAIKQRLNVSNVDRSFNNN